MENQCLECGKQYGTPRSYRQHVRVVHPELKWDDYCRKHGLAATTCHCGKPLPEQQRAPHGGGRDRIHCSPECNALANTCKRTYGISVETYWEHFRRGCAICGAPISISGRRLAIDHDHVTGKFRGLLCSNCNTGIGMFKEDTELLQKAIEYLRRAHPSGPSGV